jgi:methionyl-tRNA synthetase
MLKAEGSFILPDNVPAFEFLNLEGDKISTSRNWAVWLHEYLLDFPGKQDVLRYVLTANAPEAKDNDFTWKDFQARNNNELVAILGNFVNRTMVLTHKYFEGIVPPKGDLLESDKEALEGMLAFPGRIAGSLRSFRFREALTEFMNLARLGNKYLTDNEPWKKFPEDPVRTGTILNISLQICAQLSIVGTPFLPFSSDKIRKMLNLESFWWDDATRLEWLMPGNKLNPADYVFDKIDDGPIAAQVQRLLDTKKHNDSLLQPSVPMKPIIEYDDFSKMDIRVGTILEAERVPKTKKLLKLKIDTGIDVRTVVSGISEFFEPADIVGKKVSILVNLAPKMLKGIESKGMILMAEDAGRKLFFVTPEGEAENGSTVK